MRFAKSVCVLMLLILLAACASPSPLTSALTPAAVEASPSTQPVTPAPTADRRIQPADRAVSELEEYPCPGSDFTCMKLTVPLDHFDPANSRTISVVFAILRATGERKGLFVTATGGPGASGLAVADDYTDAFDPSIPEHFDIVFFDQRGVGASGGLQCVEAAATFYQAEMRTDLPEGEAVAIAAARTFARDCVREMGGSSLLPYLGTRQAVEDLEALRQVLGDQRLWLYGESYGTQFAQTYAAAHRDRVAGLVLDGTVDLMLSAPDFLAEQAQAFNDVLVMMLEDCNRDEVCAADFGIDAIAAYDELAEPLRVGPIPFAFTLPSGQTRNRHFTLGALETAAAGYLYSESDRMMLLRALAAAAHDDLTPLARLFYSSLGLDPETLEAIPDPTYSDAIYYAVECSDYAFYSGSPQERAQHYLRDGDAVDARVPRLGSTFYGDLPCAFWPASHDPRSHNPSHSFEFPVVVLGATADPATPVANGERVYRRLAGAYLVTTDGGSHVIFGRGDKCPDDLVTAFLVDDKLPVQRQIHCEGHVSDLYIPIAPTDAAEFVDPLDAMDSADTEIYYLPEYYNWDGETPTSVGCPFGGVVRFEIDPFKKHCLLNGLDEVGLTMEKDKHIAAYEKRAAVERPWV